MAEISTRNFAAFRPAFRMALLQQAPWSILCRLMLDSGRTAKISGIAMIAFWVAAFTIMARRPESPTRFDLLCVRWGFFPVFIVTYFLAELIERSW